MTNRELLEKKLAFIERTLREIRVHGRVQEIETDLREQRFLERELQLAIQAALDIASHIVSDNRLEEPSRAIDSITVAATTLCGCIIR